MRCSIIIRTYNEARYLPELLECIAAQDVAEGEKEVILVDSGSTDGTPEIARKAGARVLTIDRSEFSFGRSLNRGCAAARGAALVFISGHCVPKENSWLRLLTEPVISGQAALSYGSQIGGPETKYSEHQLFRKLFPTDSQNRPSLFFCNNANAALLRTVWERFRYDEELSGLEDMEMGKRLVKAGMNCAYVPEAPVYHYHHESWMQVRRRYEREALALQQIMPEVHVGLGDALRYFVAAVLGDFSRALQERCLIKRAAEIALFRFCQYHGTWRGHQIHRALSRERKERYFYPH